MVQGENFQDEVVRPALPKAWILQRAPILLCGSCKGLRWGFLAGCRAQCDRSPTRYPLHKCTAAVLKCTRVGTSTPL